MNTLSIPPHLLILSSLLSASNLFAQSVPVHSDAQPHDSYSFTQDYVRFANTAGSLVNTDEQTALQPGAQSFTISFSINSAFPSGNEGVSATSWIRLGSSGGIRDSAGAVQTPGFFASATFQPDAGDVYFGLGVAGSEDQQFSYFNQFGTAVEGSTERERSFSFKNDDVNHREIYNDEGVDLSSVDVRLTFTVGDGFMLGPTGADNIEYQFNAEFDYDSDGTTDREVTGRYMESQWGLNLWVGSEYYLWAPTLGEGVDGPPLELEVDVIIPEPASAPLIISILAFANALVFSRKSRVL